ncbi:MULTISPECIES: outer membrane protein transport protein [Sulfurimonas]|uniref:OmpP1/FadL family transporter n=1 Tax=Sulfurimonas TaxID=202746 RepID=UPI001FEBAF08|nr:outer membrane protein transport protein [Sulfurimonas indica]
MVALIFLGEMKMKKVALLSLVASSILMAGGYKIPETSTNAVALGAANVAHNQNNADAAYYNPAKMVFMSDENHIEADITYIGLDKVKWKPVAGNEIQSESEDFVIPTLHYVSGALGDNGARVGVSIVAPGGLSKRWKDAPAVYKAEEFTLTTIEVNPTAAFKINDKLGLAVGFRVIYSEGIVKSTSPIGSRYMEGDSIDYGYNLALAYNPTSDIELGLTYRSKINLTEEGNAKLYSDAGSTKFYDGWSTVSIPLPAALDIAIAYTLPTNTTLEIVYEKTYWSAYKDLNFDYTVPMPAAFDASIPKDWKDTNTFRFGLTQELDDLTLMAGLVIDESPVPNKTIGFELPDTDSTAVSLGGRYKINESIDVGLSALYSMHENRTISASDANDNGLVGGFSDGNILIISAGLGYKF